MEDITLGELLLLGDLELPPLPVHPLERLEGSLMELLKDKKAANHRHQST